MGRIYRGCSYERQSEDEAPEWQCPSCERAYDKTEAAYERSMAVAANGSGATQRQNRRASFKQDEPLYNHRTPMFSGMGNYFIGAVIFGVIIAGWQLKRVM